MKVQKRAVRGLSALAAAAAAALGVAACSGIRNTNPGLQEGRRLYLAHGCRVCHGENGFGDGPVGLTLETRPRDFRDPEAFKQGATVEDIARTIAQGIRQPNSMMQPYAHIPEADRIELAKYVRSLADATR